MFTRREILATTAAAFAAGVVAMPRSAQASSTLSGPENTGGPLADGRGFNPVNQTVPHNIIHPPGVPGQDYSPVVTPNGVALPFKIVDGVKVFHLVASEFDHEFAPGLVGRCWGYNGRTPGPTIEVVEGDRVRIYVTNQLPEPTSVHWHGVILPNGMDGVSNLTQKPIPPDETYVYEWTFRQHGTLMYHSHFDEMIQIALGMQGILVVHPRKPLEPRPDRDFALMLSEWKLDPDTHRPDPSTMTEFNILTINSRCFPGTEPLVVAQGQSVRIRVCNLSPMSHHSFHLHGHYFLKVGTDGGVIPPGAREPAVTELIGTGSTLDLQLIADNPGDWAIHCHMTHHAMNQMGHGLPNMLGLKPAELDQKLRKLLPGYMTMGDTGMGGMADMGMNVPRNTLPMVGGPGPFGYIDMGGMFTILKVRPNLKSYEDPGWYDHPAGTVAGPADPSKMRLDLAGMPAVPAAPIVGAAVSSTVVATPATQPVAEPAVLYTCPMHPEVISDKPGKCPRCGMRLVVKK